MPNPNSFSSVSYTYDQYDTITTAQTNINWSSGTVETDVFDDWTNGAKVSIPRSVSGLSDGFNYGQFIGAINDAWDNDNQASITWGEYEPQPAPTPTPEPWPTVGLGEMPADDWHDLFGIPVIDGLGDIKEELHDLLGINFDIDESVQDMIVYQQSMLDEAGDQTDVLGDIEDDTGAISTEVGNIGDDVEDIDEQVIIIVNELGDVIDVLEGAEAQAYANGQTLGRIESKTSTAAKQDEQTDILDDTKDAVQDIIPYVQPLPDVATDVETLTDILPDVATLPDIKTATETMADTLTDTLPDIATLPDIKTATESIDDTLTDTLPDIATLPDIMTDIQDDIPKIDDICLNIDEAPLKDAETGADRLPRLILPYITDLRSALGIWHYVVTWTGQISSVFSWILGVITGTAIMTPIYAAVAGYIVIHVYRRMCN